MFLKPFRVVGACVMLGSLLATSTSWAVDDTETADLLIKLLKAGRSVVSQNQALINDASKGDKGFTPAVMVAKTMQTYKAKTNIDLTRLPNTHQSRLLLELLEAEKQVIEDFQPVINKEGIGFKGVLPAVFARMVGAKFYKQTGIQMKLTSSDYRFPGNKPDAFERQVLKLFADPRYPKGKDYTKVTMLGSKPVLRVMSPEYAGASCLKCHGTPKGDRDITGGRKEGWKEGDLGGAISVVLPAK